MGAVRAVINRHRWASGLITGIGLTTLVASGIAVAATTSSSSTIHACAAKKNGAVRILTTGKHCTSKERSVSWSKGITYRGAWSAKTSYKSLDLVTVLGSSYVAKTASKGKVPPRHSSAWGLLAAAGSPGAAATAATPLSVTADSATATSDFHDVDLAALGLTMHAVCALGSQSGLYLEEDTTATTSYDALGTYDLATTGGGFGELVNNGGPGPHLATGVGVVHYTQPGSSVGTASEFVLDSNSGGGSMSFDVRVTRGSAAYRVEGTNFASGAECLVQATATRLS